jgi:hypothetical protein
MTNSLEVGEGSTSRPGHSLPQEKTRYPLYRKLDGPQGRSEQVRKISPPPGLVPRTVQSVASRYADWATRSTLAFVPIQISKYSSRQEASPYSGGTRNCDPSCTYHTSFYLEPRRNFSARSTFFCFTRYNYWCRDGRLQRACAQAVFMLLRSRVWF